LPVDEPQDKRAAGTGGQMQELGLDLAEVRKFFVDEHDQPFLLIKVPGDVAAGWAELLGVPGRRCYLSDEFLAANAARTGRDPADVIAAKLPDPGAVMSGDFGEILTALYLASMSHPADVRDPKKWRLKEDRTKPAPRSDVVQFVVQEWPTASIDDKVICAEVKTKSTNSAFTPIANAIAGSQMDRDGRLAKTLVWLRDRAHGEDLGTVSIPLLDRFIKATDHPPATHEFRAVAVICSSLVENEIADADIPPSEDCTLVVISVPDLKANYQAFYEAIIQSADLEMTQA
jgi:hypothetical protein